MTPSTPEGVLGQVFGYRNFRGHQRAIIESTIRGRDSLVIMPTGGGKSLLYQLPALLLPGTTLVVSPLIALMKDQVDALTARGVPAALINQILKIDHRLFAQIATRMRSFGAVLAACSAIADVI